MPDTPWFVSAFDRSWLRIYAHRNDDEARRAAPFIRSHLDLGVGARVLDVGCGAGRYARALAALGLRVTGIDLSRELLEAARARSPLLPGTPVYVRGDSRQLPFHMQFEAACSMFTSLGYFDTREEDVAIFRGVRRALVPGGNFLVDFLNAPRVRRELVAEGVRMEGTLRIATTRAIEQLPDGDEVVHKTVDATDAGSGRPVTSFHERVRLYTAEDIESLLIVAGLTLVGDRMGHVDARPHDDEAPRFVRVARAP